MQKLEEKLYLFEKEQKFDSVELYAKEILKIARIKKYPRDFNYIYYNCKLADALTRNGKFNQSIELISNIENDFSDSLSLYPSLYINLLITNLNNSFLTNNIDQYCLISEKLIKLIVTDTKYITSNIDYIINICSTLIDYGKIEAASNAYNILKSNYEEFYSKHNILLVRVQDLLVKIQIKKGDFSNALFYCDEVLKNKNLDNKSKEAFEISKVTCLVNLDKFDIALELNTKILKELEKTEKSQNNYSIAFNYIQQASILNHLGKFNEAGYYYEKGIHLFREKPMEMVSDDLAWALAHYAGFYQDIGLPTKSLELNKEALLIRSKNENKNTYQIILLMNSIAENYSALGNKDLAIDYCQKAINMCKTYYDSTYPIYYTTLSNLAVYESNKGNFQQALELDLQALKFKENSVGTNSIDYALSLNNISVLYFSIMDYNKATEYAEKSLRIRKKILGEKHPQYGLSLANLAVNYSKIKEFDKSILYNKEALTIYSKSKMNYTNNYNICLDNLSLTYFALSYFDSAYFNSLKSFENNLIIFNLNKLGLDEQVILNSKIRLDYSANLSNNYFFYYRNNTSKLYSNFINTKGLISNESRLLTQRIFSLKLKEEMQLFEELNTLKKNILLYYESGKQKNDLTINETIKKSRELESKLSQKLNIIKNNISLLDIKKSLVGDEIFIDFCSYPIYNFQNDKWTDSMQYLVFISDSNDTLVDFVFFENGSSFDDVYFDYKYQAAESDKKTDLKTPYFYNNFWKPIADKIGDAKTIYVSLGGVYNNINLNTIYNPETGKYLLEEKDIRIVNSARDFVLSKEGEKKTYSTNTASLYGFANFDGNSTVSADTTDIFASTRDLNSFWLDSLTRGGMKAKPLPATKTEVEYISSTLKSKGWQVKNYLADNASETNIKKEASPRILHVATHGYFFQDIPLENDNNRFLGMNRQQVVQDPMLRSMLLFTGANKTLKGESTNGENGLLSAAEASLLDLRETELVVLSACETGKGEIKNSEGVYGLRKAFADAGAQNIIMSLWKVDDNVTQEFMSRFYENWLNEKTSIREAFNKTQLEIKAKYPQPYYWGAFILVGE
jgi:CHAT domain-containing protein